MATPRQHLTESIPAQQESLAGQSEQKTPFHEEFTFKFPVVSMSDLIDIYKVEKVLKFIEDTLEKNFGIKVFDYMFTEIIKNAFDAYAPKGIVRGNEFILKVVIKEKNQKIIVNVMDNGCGFDKQPKSVYFTRKQIDYKRKPSGMFGGKRLGLVYSEKYCLNDEVTLFFKNRKKVGATASVQFNESCIRKKL